MKFVISVKEPMLDKNNSWFSLLLLMSFVCAFFQEHSRLLHNPTTHYIFFAMWVNLVRLLNKCCQLWFPKRRSFIHQNYDFTLLSTFSWLKSMFSFMGIFLDLRTTLCYITIFMICLCIFSYIPNILTTIWSLNDNPSHHKSLIFIVLISFGIPRHLLYNYYVYYVIFVQRFYTIYNIL